MAAIKAITERKLKEALLPLTAEVANMRDEQMTISGKLEAVICKAEKNYKYLFGNGEAGLDERVRNIEKQLKQQTKIFTTLSLGVGSYVLVEVVKVLLEHF